jgi:hypothetical protein
MSNSETSDISDSSGESANGNALSWMSNHWVMITMIIVGGILVLGLFQFINQFLNGTGPISKGAGDVLETAAHFVDGIMNGCLPQAQCTNESSKESCTGDNGCTWTKPDTSGKDQVGICSKTTDKKTGEGAIYSPSCALGFGWILYVGGTIFLIGARALGLLAHSKIAEKIAARGVETPGEVTKKITKEAEKITSEAMEKLKNEQVEVNDVITRDISRKITSRKAEVENIDSINGQPALSNEEKNEMKGESERDYAKAERDLAERSDTDGISKEQQEKNDRVVDEAIPHPHEVV